MTDELQAAPRGASQHGQSRRSPIRRARSCTASPGRLAARRRPEHAAAVEAARGKRAGRAARSADLAAGTMPGVTSPRLPRLSPRPLARSSRSAHQPPPASRLILLGTAGGPTPKKTRSGPSQIIVIGDRGYVVDCGDGVARQMMAAGVFRTLRHVFITHHHSDHNADYGTLLLLAWGDSLKTPVDTWGPPPLARMTKLFLEMSARGPDGAREGRRPAAAPRR